MLIVNLGTPEATDYWSMRRYLKEFLSDRRVIETPRWLWWPILNLVILTKRPTAKGKDYDSIWNKDRNEGPLKTITRAQAEKLKARARRRPSARTHGRLGHALRQAVDRRASRDLAARRMRPHPADPALPPILRGDQRDGRRRRVRSVAGDALATDAAHRRALFRPARIYLRARNIHEGVAGPARFRARCDRRLLSRHPAELFRQGRSLFLPLRQDHAAPAGQAGVAAGQADHELPVPLRRGGMAEALHGRDRARPGARRPETPRRHHAGLRR